MSETQEQTETASNQDVIEVEPGPGEPPPVPLSVANVPAKSWPPKTVGDLMTRKVITLRDDEPVGQLETSMEQFRFHHLPVIDAHSKLVGLITRTDFLHAMAEGKSDGQASAGAIMRKVVVTAKAEYALTEALGVMLKEKLSCLPVVLEDGTLVGIVTQTDFCKLALEFLEK